MATAFTPEKPGADGSRIEGPDEVEAAPPGGTDVDPAADDSGWRIRWPKDLAYPYNPPKFFHNQDKWRALLFGVLFIIGFVVACLVVHARVLLSTHCYLDPYYHMDSATTKSLWLWCELPLYFGLTSSTFAFFFFTFTFIEHISTSTRMMKIQGTVSVIAACAAFVNATMIAIGLSAWCAREIRMTSCSRSTCRAERKHIHTCVAALKYSDMVADDQHIYVLFNTCIFLVLSILLCVMWITSLVSTAREYRKAMNRHWDPNNQTLIDSSDDSSEDADTY